MTVAMLSGDVERVEALLRANHNKPVFVALNDMYGVKTPIDSLGQGVISPGNFEAGFITDNPDVISFLKVLFSEIMDGVYCGDCHLAEKFVEYLNKTTSVH